VENPVQDAFFRIEPRPEPGKVLVVGSIQKRKGILEAIKAMTLVRQHVPYAELYIAGGFSPAYRVYGDLVRDYMSETGAAGYVHFCGHLDHEALLDAYRTSQIFLFPSCLEASPIALAEAMAAGLPSVVSDIGGTEHLIRDAETGYRVPVGDVEAIAEKVVHLLKGEGLCSRIGQQARRFAKAHSTQEAAARKTHDLYLSLTESPA
jgi:glycogen(starch) synthase